MAETKNLCAQIDLALHAKVCEEKEKAGQTTSQYIAQLLTEYYEMKENGRYHRDVGQGQNDGIPDPGGTFPAGSSGTWSTKVPAWGRKVTQREFVLGLIESALAQAEAEEAAAQEH